jgi:hypothetical protein
MEERLTEEQIEEQMSTLEEEEWTSCRISHGIREFHQMVKEIKMAECLMPTGEQK